jgi:hypothetical protein
MNPTKPKLSAGQRFAVALLFAVPVLLILAKQSWSPWADVLARHLSLLDLPQKVERSVGHVVLLPLGALVVVFLRVTLGIRVLGPFRSVLLAMAFQVTGIPVGLLFLALVVGSIVMLRRPLGALGLSYYGRVTTMFTAVGGILAVTLLTSSWLNLEFLYGVVHFPMVVLCLLADAFAKTLENEGPASALWRGTMTAVAAVLITLLAGIPALQGLLLRYPELLAGQIGVIVLITRFLSFRVLERFNLEPVAASEEATAAATTPAQNPASSFGKRGSDGLLKKRTNQTEAVVKFQGELI